MHTPQRERERERERGKERGRGRTRWREKVRTCIFAIAMHGCTFWLAYDASIHVGRVCDDHAWRHHDCPDTWWLVATSQPRPVVGTNLSRCRRIPPLSWTLDMERGTRWVFGTGVPALVRLDARGAGVGTMRHWVSVSVSAKSFPEIREALCRKPSARRAERKITHVR